MVNNLKYTIRICNDDETMLNLMRKIVVVSFDDVGRKYEVWSTDRATYACRMGQSHYFSRSEIVRYSKSWYSKRYSDELTKYRVEYKTSIKAFDKAMKMKAFG